MAFARGENVGPYRIVDQLGQGGMASVFKAYHAALDRYVALKVLHPAFLQDPNFLARFQREARVVAKLDHPNIVPIYDFAEHQGQPYLVMKYIEGRTLKALLSDGSLPQERQLEIIGAVGKGLSYAHQRGVLHRDVKPSNVLLSAGGGIYLADFGLARIAQAGASTLSSDMLLGTPQYISPEQAKGDHELDEGTDIYSFGVVIYEMTVGRVPFNADTPFSIIHDHIYTPLPMPRAVNPNVPERVERVLLKALAKERADRFETVPDLVNAFEGAVVDERDTVPLEALPQEQTQALQEASAVERRDEPKGKSRRWWWVAGGLALSCLCLFAFMALANALEERNRAEAATATASARISDQSPVTEEPTVEVDDPRILELREALAADPRNPELHQELARAFIDTGFPGLAFRHWLLAAEIYMEEGAFAEAAKAYNEAIAIAGGPQEIEGPVREAAAEALFMTTSSPRQALPLLDRLRRQHPEWTILQPLTARAEMFNGNLLPAISELERIQAETKDPLLDAVLAEGYLLNGQLVEARELASSVLENPRIPTWLRQHVEEIVNQIEASN